MTGIESLIAIIALIGQFRSERGDKERASFEEFMQWLSQQNHSEIKKLLELNVNATIGIKALLNQDRTLLLERLASIDQTLSAIAANHEGFRELAIGLNPISVLSGQAVRILAQFRDAKASKALDIHTNDGSEYLFLDGVGGGIEITEPQFVEDDFSTLVEHRFLREGRNVKGQKVFVFTRLGESVVRGDGS